VVEEAEHTAMHGEGVVVVRVAGTAAFAADIGLAHPGTAGKEVGVESAVGLACTETAHYAVVRTEPLRCFHKDVVAILGTDVQQVEIASGVLELGSDVGLVGGVRCAVCETADLGCMAGSDTTGRCKEGVEIVGIAEVVVLEVGRGLAVETLMQQAVEVLSSVFAPEQPASSGEKWLSVRSVMLLNPTQAAMAHPALAHYERRSDQAVDSLQAAEASVPNAVISSVM
jgi:hypothetical protein